MRVNASYGWSVRSESPPNSHTVFDDLSARMYPGPNIIFRVGAVGIGDVPKDGRYVFGFIQFITRYLFQIDYEGGLMEIKPKTPLNDSDPSEMGEKTPEQVDVEDPLFYDRPLRIRQKDWVRTGGWQNFESYSIAVGDGPGFDFPYYHNGDLDNPLRRILRQHRFETWAVIWDLQAKAMAQALVRFTWEHYVDALIDPTKPIGQRITLRQCFSRELEDKRQVGAAIGTETIPDRALRAPTANEETPKHRYYRNVQVLPALSLQDSF